MLYSSSSMDVRTIKRLFELVLVVHVVDFEFGTFGIFTVTSEYIHFEYMSNDSFILIVYVVYVSNSITDTL